MLDQLAKVCVFFMLVPVLAFLMLLRVQFLNLQKKTYRLTVLCVRAALFLPLYAIFIYLSVLVPSAYVLMIVVITVVEGYSFYCFLSLIITNLGGPAATVDIMHHSDRQLVCSCCCPSDSVIFYQKTTWAIFHLFITRSILAVFSAICFYSHTQVGKLVYVFLNCMAAAILFYGVACLVNLYENVFEYCTNLFGVVKLILLKISVGAIVVQGLIESFLYSSGTSPYKDDDQYDAEEKTLRAYCVLVLMEFVLMSFVYYYAFGYKVITESTASYKTPSGENIDAFVNNGAGNSIENSTNDRPKFSFWMFLGDVLRFHDVVGVLTYKGELYSPLDMDEEGGH